MCVCQLIGADVLFGVYALVCCFLYLLSGYMSDDKQVCRFHEFAML